MSDSKFTEKVLDKDPEPDPRDDMIASVDGAIAEVERKVKNGRVRSPENEKVRIKQYRALGYLLRTKLKILQQQELDEMWKMIEELKDELDDDKA
jgi:hypothetical protein